MGEPGERIVTFARRRLLRQVEAARERILLVSPFISAPVASALCEAAATSSAPDRRLLTALTPRSVQCGVLDPRALAQLQECRFVIASIENLHAKVTLVDSTWGLVGSGNLTGAGLGDEDGGGNYEMGVLLTPSQREVASRTAERWWRVARAVSPELIAKYAALPKLPKPPIGAVGPTIPPPSTEGLVDVLAEDAATAASRRYWINPNYHDPDNEFWWRRGWVSDAGPRRYRVGDLLVLYLGKTNKGPQRCPAVLRVTELCRYDPEFVLAERDVEAAEQWPYVTRGALVSELAPWAGARLEAAGKTPLSVENGCKLTRAEFEQIAVAMLDQS